MIILILIISLISAGRYSNSGEMSPESINIALSSEFRNRYNEEISGVFLLLVRRGMIIFSDSKRKLVTGEKKNFNLKSFASQGEHKTFLVALKLAEYYYLKDRSGTCPVLLLDDVLSELDSGRISKIVSHLNNFGQVILTTTDRNYSEGINRFYDNDEITFLI